MSVITAKRIVIALAVLAVLVVILAINGFGKPSETGLESSAKFSAKTAAKRVSRISDENEDRFMQRTNADATLIEPIQRATKIPVKLVVTLAAIPAVKTNTLFILADQTTQSKFVAVVKVPTGYGYGITVIPTEEDTRFLVKDNHLADFAPNSPWTKP